jgi:hypothetical protein
MRRLSLRAACLQTVRPSSNCDDSPSHRPARNVYTAWALFSDNFVGTNDDLAKVFLWAFANLTRRRLHDNYTFGEWSNPLTGKVVSYTQNNLITDVLAVPGDFTSSTQTVTGENIYRAGTGAPVFIATGRQVWNFDESVLISSAGRNGFVAAFFEGDSTAFDALCAALA